jgi:hypothetical protein
MTYKPILLFDEGEQGIPVVEKSNKRTVPKTSRDANDSVKEMKGIHYIKILESLTLLKVGGTYEEISLMTQLDKAQVNRRLSEMVEAGTVFNVGITRPTLSGRKSMVRQISEKGKEFLINK